MASDFETTRAAQLTPKTLALHDAFVGSRQRFRSGPPSMHVSEISAPAGTHLSEITAPSIIHQPEAPNNAPTSARERGPSHTQPSSGAGRAKREQLKRKAQRQQIQQNYYTNKYNAEKRDKRSKREEWVKNNSMEDAWPPQEILRSHPCIHPRTNFDKVKPAGQRMYRPQVNRTAETSMTLGESAVE